MKQRENGTRALSATTGKAACFHYGLELAIGSLCYTNNVVSVWQPESVDGQRASKQAVGVVRVLVICREQ